MELSDRYIMAFDAVQLLGSESLDYLYDIQEETERARVTAIYSARAKALGIEKQFAATIKAYDKEEQRLISNYINAGIPRPPYISLTQNGAYCVNCPQLAQYIRENAHYLFVKDNASGGVNRFWYSDGCYRPIDDDIFKGYIKKYISDFDENAVKMSDVREVFQDLTTDLNFVDGNMLNSDENIINFQNGLLHLDTMKLTAHTPSIYTTIQIPCNWNEKPEQADVFNRFMDKLTDGDKGKWELLMQFIGACLSNIKGYRMKKALFMVGAGDTGKSQLKILTEGLLGNNNFSAIDLPELEERFGTSNLYNKRLVGSSDMSFVSVKELKVFKKATGGDNIWAEFKGRSGFEFTYNGLLWFCMNRLPKFGGDRGQWVYDRIVTVECNNVIPKSEQDKFLCDKMFAERESIVHMAVMALKRLISNGYEFNIPESCIKQNEVYQKQNSPVQLFFDECCVQRPSRKLNDNCTAKRMYDVFSAWCRDNNNGYSPSNQDFRRELSEITGKDLGELDLKSCGIRYYPFTLNAEAKENYKGVYGYDSVS